MAIATSKGWPKVFGAMDKPKTEREWDRSPSVQVDPGGTYHIHLVKVNRDLTRVLGHPKIGRRFGRDKWGTPKISENR